MKVAWPTCPLEDVCEFQNGYAFRNEDYVNEPAGAYEVFRMGHICRGGGFDPDASRVFIPKSKAEKLERFVLQKNDILMSMTDMKASMALLGHTALLPIGGKFLLNQRVGRITIRDRGRLDFRFLYYYTNTAEYVQYLRSRANSGVQVNLSTNVIKKSPVPVPPISTQRKIAAILSAYDDLIENNKRRIKILEEMAQNLYREWFVKFRFPGHQHARFNPSQSGRIPEGWRWAKLKDVCDSINYGFTASANKEVVGPKFLRITDIVPSTIDWESVPYCEVEPAEAEKYAIFEGDIVIARTGATTGYAKRLNKRHPNSIFASYLVRIRPNAVLGKQYTGVIVESNNYKEFIKRNIGGAAQPQANAQVLTSIDILVPAADVIQAFDELVQPMVDKKELLQIKNRKLRRTRDLLLPKLITGEVDVSELDIQTPEEETSLAEVTPILSRPARIEDANRPLNAPSRSYL